MTAINSSTILCGDRKSAFQLIEKLEFFSQLIAGVEEVNIKRLSDKKRISEWTINANGMRVVWKEENIFDEANGIILFRMVDGPFKFYEGKWHIHDSSNSHVQITFSLSIEWGKLLDLGESEEDLTRRAKLAIKWMLRKLRERSQTLLVIPKDAPTVVEQRIVSEFVSYRNKRGKRIVGVYDHLRQVGPEEPLLVMPPGYGETKRDVLTLAYYLVRNGFRVIRYDATDHLGESEGDIFYTSLPKMKEDLDATLDFVEEQFGLREVSVIAGSLAKRIAIRAAIEDTRIRFLVSLVGVVDVQATLKAVYYEDIIGAFLNNKGWDSADILGFEVGRQFPETTIEEQYHSLSTTLQEVRKLKIPVVFFVAEEDTWVNLEDVKLVFESIGHEQREFHIIPDSMHRLHENPKSARWTLRQIVVSCKKYLKNEIITINDVEEPSIRDVATQNSVEKNRLRAMRIVTKETEKEFWGNYLSKYALITKSHDFRDLLSLADLMLGPSKENELILDAGCGSGHYGAWLIWSTAVRSSEEIKLYGPSKLPQRNYVGVDFVDNALREASHRLTTFQAEVETKNDKNVGLRFSFVLADLDYELPFPGNSFDKVFCNLVLSYVQNPKFTVRELMRVLKPNSRIVVTSLKPYADLSQIYRNFVVQCNGEQEVQEARQLLSNAGKIRQREEEGQYQFFSESKLRMLINSVGGKDVKSFHAFGGQAYVVVASKADSIK